MFWRAKHHKTRREYDDERYLRDILPNRLRQERHDSNMNVTNGTCPPGPPFTPRFGAECQFCKRQTQCMHCVSYAVNTYEMAYPGFMCCEDCKSDILDIEWTYSNKSGWYRKDGIR